MVDAALIEKMKCNIPPLAEFRDNIEILEVKEPGYVHFTMDTSLVKSAAGLPHIRSV